MQDERSYFYVFDSQSGIDGISGDKASAPTRPRPSLTIDRVKSWGGIGALWGGIFGLLLAPTNVLSFLPGIDLASRGGPWTVALVGAFEGALLIGGLLALGAALTRRRLPKTRADRT